MCLTKLNDDLAGVFKLMQGHIDPRRIEKSDIFKTGVWLGSAVLGIPVLSYLLSYVSVYFYAFAFSVNLQEAMSAIYNDYILGNIVNVLFSTVIFIPLFALAAKMLRCGTVLKRSFDRPVVSANLTWICIVFALGVSLLGNIATNIFSSFTEIFFNVQPYQPSYGTGEEIGALPQMLISVFCVSAAPALLEEFAFRGVVLSAMRKFGDWPAIILSAVLFSLMHGNFVQIPFTIFFGIAAGVITVMTGSIWPAVFVHFANNLLAEFSAFMPSSIFAILFYGLIILGIIAYVNMQKGGVFQTVRDVPSCLTRSKRILWVFTSPTMIIAVLLFLSEALQQFTVA